MLPDPRPYFAELNDPRRETKNKLHKLGDILMIVLCAVLSGIEDWVGMEEFALQKEGWFRGFLELENGIPSHDTISDVMGRIERYSFADAFMRWVRVALPSLSGEQVCVDGKTLRGSREGDKAVHLVSAYAAKARLVLALAKRWRTSRTKSPRCRTCCRCWTWKGRSSRRTRWVAKRPSPASRPAATASAATSAGWSRGRNGRGWRP
jgi:hypothetical protein